MVGLAWCVVTCAHRVVCNVCACAYRDCGPAFAYRVVGPVMCAQAYMGLWARSHVHMCSVTCTRAHKGWWAQSCVRMYIWGCESSHVCACVYGVVGPVIWDCGPGHRCV